MDREFLEGLGITDDNIDLILDAANSQLSKERLFNSLKTEILNQLQVDYILTLFSLFYCFPNFFKFIIYFSHSVSRHFLHFSVVSNKPVNFVFDVRYLRVDST